MPDTNQRLRSLWKNVQERWKELQQAIEAQRALDPRSDMAAFRQARERVQRTVKAHSDAINAYTELFNSRIHPGRQASGRRR